MSLAKNLDPPEDIYEEIVFPPSDLWSDEPPLESDLHRLQMQLLIDSLNWLWCDSPNSDRFASRDDFYASGNLTIYYNPEQIKSRDFRLTQTSSSCWE